MILRILIGAAAGAGLGFGRHNSPAARPAPVR